MKRKRFYVHANLDASETEWEIRDRKYEKPDVVCIEAARIAAREDARIMCKALNEHEERRGK